MIAPSSRPLDRRPHRRLAIAMSCVLLVSCARATRPATASTAGTSAACFPIESLSAADRVVADRVLLEFGDREGLYTLAGGLKPISSDVRDMQVRIAPTIDTIALQRLEQLRRVSNALHCGSLGVFVQVFTATSPGRDSSVVRQATLVLYHRESVQRAIGRQRTFFASLGITLSADPRDVLATVENAPRDARWRGYGYLFGYPDEAVDFFVTAGVEGDRDKRIVPREFRRIETFHKYPESAGGPPVVSSFVYAVPKGAALSPGDRQLRESAAPIYARYITARSTAIRADSSGAVDLWRTWMARR